MMERVEIDARVIRLVRELNRVPHLWTTCNCGGHARPQAGQVPAGEYCIGLSVEPTRRGWASLSLVVWAATEAMAEEGLPIDVFAWTDAGEAHLYAVHFEVDGRRGASSDVRARLLRRGNLGPVASERRFVAVVLVAVRGGLRTIHRRRHE